MGAPFLEVFGAATGAAQKIFFVLDSEPKINKYKNCGIRPNRFNSNITFDNVHFNYPSRPEVKVNILSWIMTIFNDFIYYWLMYEVLPKSCETLNTGCEQIIVPTSSVRCVIVHHLGISGPRGAVLIPSKSSVERFVSVVFSPFCNMYSKWAADLLETTNDLVDHRLA